MAKLTLILILIMFASANSEESNSTPFIFKKAKFRFSELTKEQLKASDYIKSKKLKERYKYWQIAIKPLPYPLPEKNVERTLISKTMTREQVIKYLGKPDSINKNKTTECLIYEMGDYKNAEDKKMIMERCCFVIIHKGKVFWFGSSWGTK